jgi:hypothetical protein
VGEAPHDVSARAVVGVLAEAHGGPGSAWGVKEGQAFEGEESSGREAVSASRPYREEVSFIRLIGSMGSRQEDGPPPFNRIPPFGPSRFEPARPARGNRRRP